MAAPRNPARQPALPAARPTAIPFDPDFWSKKIEQERKSLEESQSMVEAENFTRERTA
jgi:hypothetical protein